MSVECAYYLRGARDEVVGLRQQLTAALEANLALLGVRQNAIASQQSR